MSACSVPTYVKPRFDTSRLRQVFPCKLANTEIHDSGPQRDIQKNHALVALRFLEIGRVLVRFKHVASVIKLFGSQHDVID